LGHSSRILADSGWKVLFLGTGAFNKADDLAFQKHPLIFVKKMPYCSNRLFLKLHYLIYCLWVLSRLFLFRPQWIYVSDPISCPVAFMSSLFSNCRIIYHEHDSPNPEKHDMKLLDRLVLACRYKLLEAAALCIFPNEDRMKLAPMYDKRPEKFFCVWNCPSHEEVSLPEKLQAKGDFWLLYHGSIVPDRLPFTVIQALKLLPEYVKLRIIGYVTIGQERYLDQLRAFSEQAGLSRRIEYLGILQRNALLKYSQNCSVGIALMPKVGNNVNMRHMVGASCKAFDYMACELPLLVSDLSDWKSLYVAAGNALACNPDDPQSIATAIMWYLDNPVTMKKMGTSGMKQILASWNYEKQFQPVMDHIHLPMGAQ
jgi:glycosyltransferase involved in cell wall biosynthesis